jgi:hypothetical protein
MGSWRRASGSRPIVPTPSSMQESTNGTASTHAVAPLSALSVGAAGEHYVAMRLNMLGVDTGLVPAGNPTTDVLAHRAGATASIQVKSNRGRITPLPGAIPMNPKLAVRPDFLVIVLLGLGTVPEHAEPVAFVLPREATEILCQDFNNHNPKVPVTKMTLATIAYLTPYREAWHLIEQHLADAMPTEHE